MKPDNLCPSCGKAHATRPKKCICGWFMTKEPEMKLDRSKCHYIELGKQCQNPGTIAIGKWGKDWFCSDHEKKLRELSYKY